MTDDSVTSSDGTSIAYTARGDGDPLIIVDGATACRATTPENEATAELMAAEFRVITYDRRGRGESGDTPPYAPQREFDDLAAIIEQAGDSRPATVFGWSSGALLALNAVQAGVPADRLALFEPPVVVDDSRPPVPSDYVATLEAAVADGRPGDAAELFLTVAVGLPADMVADMRGDADVWAGLEGVAPTLAYDGRQMGDTMSGRPLRTDLWDEVEVPTLVLHGHHTSPSLVTGARAVAEHVAPATLKPVPGENHSTTPDVLAATLRDFIKEA